MDRGVDTVAHYCIGMIVVLGACVMPLPVARAQVAGAPGTRAQYTDSLLLRDLQAERPDLQQRLSRPLSLTDCVEIAMQRNLPLSVALHERDIVDRGVDAAVGDWLPVLTVQTRRVNQSTDFESLGVFVEEIGTTLEAAVVQRLPLGGGLTLGYNFDKFGEDANPGFGGFVSVVQPLLRDAGWKKATSDIDDARFAASAEEANLRSTFLDTVFRVQSSYYEVLRRHKLVEVNERAIARDEQLLAFSQAKVDAKLATRRDVLSAEIILAQDRGKLVNAQTEHRAALDDLADVLGIRVERPIDIVYVEVEPTPIEKDEQSWVTKALRDNPDVQRARFEVERDELAMHVAGNDRLPRLDLALRYDELRDSILEDLPRARRGRGHAWEGRITLSYPILNKPLSSAHRQAQLRHEQTRRLLLETERQVVLQVRDSVRNLERIEERIEVLEKTIEGARDKVEFANVNFQLGRASNLDITDAQKDLTEAESDLVEEIMDHRVELARLENLLGGSLP